MPTFQYQHTVSFQETSLVGNVYFSNYLLWQGHCREMFLGEYAPSVIAGLQGGNLALLTRSCSCDYEGDWGFAALDEVLISMRLEEFRGGRMALGFTYARADSPDEIVARGTQKVDCKVLHGDQWVAAPFPAELIRALLQFADDEALRSALNDALDFIGDGQSGAEGSRVAR